MNTKESKAAHEVTIGVDIGTTSVKALAVDGEGNVLARSRVPHRIVTPGPNLLEHEVEKAWRQGPKKAYAEVAAAVGHGPGTIGGVGVTSMVPSLTAVGPRGAPLLPGILYGDARGSATDDPSGMPNAIGFLEWASSQAPEAEGYWPCQATAVHALCGTAALDTAAAIVFGDLYSFGDWQADKLASHGANPSQMPKVVTMGVAGGETPDGVPVAGGTIDALCDQLVSSAAEPGDVLAIFGATLVVWIVTEDWRERPGLVTVPHTVPSRMLIGGPSNAGALFVDWARNLLNGARSPGPQDPHMKEEFGRDVTPNRVPVWLPYIRGERTPYSDPNLRGSVHDLEITQTTKSLERGVYEASGFVIKRMLEMADVVPNRIVASGGGSQLGAWMAAVADAVGTPVCPVEVAEGAALGAAYVGRVAAGFVTGFDESTSWAKDRAQIDPDPQFSAAAQDRYQRFLTYSQELQDRSAP